MFRKNLFAAAVVTYFCCVVGSRQKVSLAFNNPENGLFATGDDSVCPQEHNPPAGTITSPNYPQVYDNRVFCDIILMLHNPLRIWKDISITVNAFVTERKHDKLIINGVEYSGNGTSDPGALQVGRTYLFRNNFLWFHMRFVTDGSVQKMGFSIDYTVEDSSENHNITEVCGTVNNRVCGRNGVCHSHVEGFTCVCKPQWSGPRCDQRVVVGDCPITLQPPAGTMTSYNYPGTYPNSFKCQISIRIQDSPNGWNDIFMTVDDFITERCCDRLTINSRTYAGNGSKDTGALQKGQTYKFRSNRRDFMMSFRTDGSVVYKGYSIRYNLQRSPDQGNRVTETCSSRPCQNGGTCHSYRNGPTCLCRTGYSGTMCEYRSDTKGCPFRYRTARVTVQSINYPRPYPSNMHCRYLFDLSRYNRFPWKQIRLYVWYFETEKNRDVLDLNGLQRFSGWGYFDRDSAPENRKWYYLYTQADTFNMTFMTKFIGTRLHPGWAMNFYLYGLQRPPPGGVIIDRLYMDHDDYSVPENTNTVVFDEETGEEVEYEGEPINFGLAPSKPRGQNLYYELQSRACPLYVYAPRGIIQSPGFPRGYTNRLFCDIILYTRNNNQNIWKDITITVQAFMTETKRDRLILNGREYSGNGSDPNARTALQVGRRYLFRNNYIWFHMRFRTDSRNVFPGFRFQYYVTTSKERHNITEFCENNPCGRNGECHSHVEGFVCYCKPGYTGTLCDMVIIVPSTCPKTLNPPTGIMQSDNYPNRYANGILCQYTLNLNNERQAWKDITMTVDGFKTESCCDRLTINGRPYAGDGSVTGSGDRRGMRAMMEGRTYLFRSRDVSFVMNFRTDRSVTYKGFSISYNVRNSASPDGLTESCVNNPCQNSGICHSLDSGPMCICPPKYSGNLCQSIRETFNCPRHYFEPVGIIQSPNWPLPYPRNAICNYYITVDGIQGAYRELLVYVQYFETERRRDVLTINGIQYSGFGYFDDSAMGIIQTYKFFTKGNQFNITFKAGRARDRHPGFSLQYLVQSADTTVTYPPTSPSTRDPGEFTSRATMPPQTRPTEPPQTQPRVTTPRITMPPWTGTPPGTFPPFTGFWTTRPNQQRTPAPRKGNGIGAGGIVGICIAVLIVIGVGGFVGFLFMKKRGLTLGLKQAMKPGFDNAVYGQNEERVNIGNVIATGSRA
ncbi:unnamed protein product [Owenia fusiformis]|uniref:Cubilin n=1 Tax=Owenia fusiformis TaxID=6347 RepID=A0A8S4MXD7_OWEFU|nr:unnamed protein product [Owenia fusiformis]